MDIVDHISIAFFAMGVSTLLPRRPPYLFLFECGSGVGGDGNDLNCGDCLIMISSVTMRKEKRYYH